jgi:YVTN family beta-propeller protein
MLDTMTWRTLVLAASALAALGAQSHHGPGYHVLRTHVLGGDGGWDYVALDSTRHRLFIARQDRVLVVNPDDGSMLGVIPGLDRAHGVAIVDAVGRGFATSGRDGTIRMFDLKSLAELAKIEAAPDADAILYDPASKRVFSMNGDSKSSTVVDPATGKVVGTIDLGGAPEFGVASFDGKVYANIEDKAEIVEIDSHALKVLRRWSIAPCESPTGLAMDRAHKRLFSGCRNKIMTISDAGAGKVITTVPIGAGVDANAFDPGTQLAFSSNGDGTLTVVHEDSPSAFTVVETVPTMQGARTMALDPATHRIYLVSAKFGPPPAESTAANPRRRPPVLPGTFALLVVGT